MSAETSPQTGDAGMRAPGEAGRDARPLSELSLSEILQREEDARDGFEPFEVFHDWSEPHDDEEDRSPAPLL
jgi:hypothetical protein